MLKLKDVTIKHGSQLILNSCNCNINSQSIIVSKNDINTDIIARTITGFRPVDEGEIHLQENMMAKKVTAIKKVFFLIPENYHKLWKNYCLHEIPRVMKIKIQLSPLLNKYNIPSNVSIDSLTKFQRLIYFISLGHLLNRSVFIFDQPTKYFDYDDLEQFYNFLNGDFSDANYVIFTNRIEEIFARLAIPIYQIHSTKMKALKGGDQIVEQIKLL
ncbi:hypothetical protein [Bacillus sp. FJAT-47783]|uniref:hypothetical protein n=1 Tax=Bacillus sp. FJAT-47783 TaxID=2922712 RepID=UPI001FABF7CA|nr:hypothetical protein [Bacillus sp. FJAT-47783]